MLTFCRAVSAAAVAVLPVAPAGCRSAVMISPTAAPPAVKFAVNITCCG